MANNVEKYTSAGLYAASYGFIDADGYFVGAATSLANGSDSGGVEIDGIDSFDFQVQEPRIVTTKGNDGAIGTFVFPPDQNPNGSMAVGSFNSQLAALAQGGLVFAEGVWDIVQIQPQDFDYKTICLVTNSKAQSRDSGSVGIAGYFVQIFPRCTLVPLHAAGLRNATESQFTHRVIANASDKYPWGHALALADEGTTKSVGFQFYSPYPVIMHGYKSDGATLTFTLDKTPTAGASNDVALWKNGTKLTYTTDYTVTPATKTVTLVAAGSAGDDFVVLYQYDPTA